jgi:hypothetical protein
MKRQKSQLQRLLQDKEGVNRAKLHFNRYASIVLHPYVYDVHHPI